jgi:geranylgeranyl pyrophosphate synthase
MDKLPKYEPHLFTEADLPPDVLDVEIRNALGTYEGWRDTNADLIAEHVNDMTAALDATARGSGTIRKLGTLAGHFANGSATQENEFIEYFGLQNLGEKPEPHSVQLLRGRLHEARRQHYPHSADALDKSFGVLQEFVPELKGLPEMDWLENRVRYLRTILPEDVIRAGGLGKTMRIIIGVLTVAAYDIADEPIAVRQEHLQRVVSGAYAWGATYALIDDTLQSRASTSISDQEKDRYNEAILYSLTTGEASDLADSVNHPVGAELDQVYKSLLQDYPFQEYRHLYHSIESMYRAQQREMQLTPETVAAAGGTRSMYPDMAIKAGMTRVVANILGRRSVSTDHYTTFLNGVFATQLKDDLEDHVPDKLAGDYTPFTLPYTPELDNQGPLYDLFAYDAFLRHIIWRKHPEVSPRLLRFTQSEVAPYLALNKEQAPDILSTWPHTEEIARYIAHATDMTLRQAHHVLPFDMRLEETMRRTLSDRDQTAVDPRTFLSDRLAYINRVVGSAIDTNSFLGEVATYALEAGGKRVRPGLTLMLAESLGVPYDHVEPLLQASELFHTSSLVFDDLPAQDNSGLRRGKLTTHVAYPEWGAQLAGIAMLSRAYGVFPKLVEHFPPERVNEVVHYIDSALGFEGISRGQALDLAQSSQELMTPDDILEMYRLKTSVALEASLVPLMILLGRSNEEIKYISEYARYAGIVFQIKDDLLDMYASTEQAGKDTQHDTGKANIARNYGPDEAERLIRENLVAATACLEKLHFNTRLLEGILHYFANRTK